MDNKELLKELESLNVNGTKITKNMITGICKLWEIIFNEEVNISLPGIVVTIKSP